MNIGRDLGVVAIVTVQHDGVYDYESHTAICLLKACTRDRVILLYLSYYINYYYCASLYCQYSQGLYYCSSAVIYLLQNVRGTLAKAIRFSGSTFDMHVFADTDWTGDILTRRSTTGYIVFAAGGYICNGKNV